MYHVVAATRNPAKISAITRAFTDVFGPDQCHISAAETENGVADQPMSSQETLTGARQRVSNARQQHPEADFGSPSKPVLMKIRRLAGLL